ncbi:MAG: hypothetical protein JEZ08_00965 [Clostridiales bacterium]|nr:hypothetical protein [Clostridiales bacterium]
MNKKITLLILIGLIGLLVIQQTKMNHLKSSFREKEQELRVEKYKLEETNIELTSEVKTKEVLIDAYTSDTHVYRDIFFTILDSSYNGSISNLNKLYDMESYFEVDDKKVNIPKEGKLFITSDTFTFKATITPPPEVMDEQINRILSDNGMRPIFQTLYYPTADIQTETDTELMLTYSNIEVGERIQFVTTERFRDAFGIYSDSITITRVDQTSYEKGNDYFVTEPMVVTFNTEESEVIYDYYEVTDTYLKIKTTYKEEFPVTDVESKLFISNHAVGYSYMFHEDDSDETVLLDYIILPSLIIENYEWSTDFGDAYHILTNIDLKVNSLNQVFNCIEVSTFYQDELMRKDYYAKGFGLIKSVFPHNEPSEVISIELYN